MSFSEDILKLFTADNPTVSYEDMDKAFSWYSIQQIKAAVQRLMGRGTAPRKIYIADWANDSKGKLSPLFALGDQEDVPRDGCTQEDLETKIIELLGKKGGLIPEQIVAAFPEVRETSVRHAIRKLRGDKGSEKRIRAKHYQRQVGGGGKPNPVLVPGSAPDAPHELQFMVKDDEALARARLTRSRAEDLKLQRELAAIDNYL